jgi:hypothetical protein
MPRYQYSKQRPRSSANLTSGSQRLSGWLVFMRPSSGPKRKFFVRSVDTRDLAIGTVLRIVGIDANLIYARANSGEEFRSLIIGDEKVIELASDAFAAP